jgi:FKBP-type peptidyl-prolyl cis-trans isomerase FkpA
METIVEGKGKAIVKDDNAKVNYKGMLIDGKVFDESSKHGGPQTFKVGGIIKCWNEALEFMKVGGKAKIYCPSELGWGDQANGDIPAGATTVFEIEVVEVVK